MITKLSDYKDPESLINEIKRLSDKDLAELPESIFKELVEKTHDQYNCTLLPWNFCTTPCVVEGSHNAFFWGMNIDEDGKVYVVIRVRNSLKSGDDEVISFPLSMFTNGGNGCQGLTPEKQLYYCFYDMHVGRCLSMMLYMYVHTVFNYNGPY